MAFAILRFQKLKSLAVIDQAVAHLERTRTTLNADRAKTNEWLTRPAGELSIREAVAGRLPVNRRTDAVVAMEALLSASPEHFRPNDPSGAGRWSQERSRAWIDRAHGWLQAQFGDRLIGAVAHLDEATPHLQAIIVPIDDRGRLCAKNMFGPAALRRMQTSYGRALASLGIERGIAGSVATHRDVREWYGAVEAAREPLQLTAADRLKLAAGITPDAIVELQSQAEAGRLMKKDRDEANATKAKMARERDEAKRQAGLVRTLPLDRVMKVLGGEQDPDDPLKWNLPSLGATTIDKAKPHRFFSERANGGGAIDLVKAETGWDFDQAVRFLGTEFTATAVAADAAHMAALTVGDDVRQKLTDKEAPLRLEDRAPAAAEADWSAAIKVLVADGIDAEIIQSAIDTGALAVTRQGERIMCRWTLTDDAGKPVGFQLQAIKGDFTVVRGKHGIFASEADQLAQGLHGDDSPELWVARAPVEAMAAISACRTMGVPEIEPGPRARAVATIDTSPAAVDAVARMAENEGATVVICTAATPSGAAIAASLATRLDADKIKQPGLRRALDVVGAKNWLDLARKMAAGASAIVGQVQVAYAKLAAALNSPKRPTRGRGIVDD